MIAKHLHNWHCLRDDFVICEACDTTTHIRDLLANTETEAIKQTKIAVYSHQLFAGHLKKTAHDEAYAWVRRDNPEALPAKQGVLV